MIFSTTPTLEGHPIREYRGVVTGETIIGANVFKDFMAGIRDFFGGRSGTYEKVLRQAKDSAMQEMAQRAETNGLQRHRRHRPRLRNGRRERIDAYGYVQRNGCGYIKKWNGCGYIKKWRGCAKSQNNAGSVA